jgi:hypothetical protein
MKPCTSCYTHLLLQAPPATGTPKGCRCRRGTHQHALLLPLGAPHRQWGPCARLTLETCCPAESPQCLHLNPPTRTNSTLGCTAFRSEAYKAYLGMAYVRHTWGAVPCMSGGCIAHHLLLHTTIWCSWMSVLAQHHLHACLDDPGLEYVEAQGTAHEACIMAKA